MLRPFSAPATIFGFPNDSRNLAAERSNSGSDQRHRFINSFVLEVPVGNGRRFLTGAHGLMQQALGGWSLSGITNIATGNPFTVYANPAIDFSGFNSFADRPDIVGSGSLAINRGDPDHFFDPAFFGKTDPNALCPGSTTNNPANGCAPSGRVGTTPRNAYCGPGLISFDTTASKSFQIHERLKLEHRADFFNAVNHTDFAVLARNGSENNGAFGILSSTSPFNNGDTGICPGSVTLCAPPANQPSRSRTRLQESGCLEFWPHIPKRKKLSATLLNVSLAP
jgi:hypothetical protein